MGQVLVEVIRDARLKPIPVDIHQERIAAGLHARKRYREQLRQRRPVEPLVAYRRRLVRQAERQHRIVVLIEGFRRCLRRGCEFLSLAPAPEVTELHAAGRRMIGLADQRRDGCAHLNAHRVVLCGEDAGVRRAIGRYFAGFIFVAVEAVDADGIERLKVAFAHAGEGQAVQP